ncbi:MAG: Smr/MutS family protein [Pseudomonadota bacterium]
MSGRRPLTKDELDLWRRSTADVRPLIDRSEKKEASQSSTDPKPAEAAGDPKPRPPIGKARTGRPAKTASTRALDPKGPVDIDRRNWERLKRGQIRVERTLDLHGLTQTEAHGELDRFLTMASVSGLRCVLVVTGKGGADGRGVLRQMVPRWLDEADNRRIVLTFCPAQPRHGGNGALYVLLRRRREGSNR